MDKERGSLPSTILMFIIMVVGLIGIIYVMADMQGYQMSFFHNISSDNFNPDSPLNNPLYNNTVNMTAAVVSGVAVNWALLVGIAVFISAIIIAVALLTGRR